MSDAKLSILPLSEMFQYAVMVLDTRCTPGKKCARKG